MKTKYLFAGLSVAALALLSGCAGNVNAKASIDYANDHKTIAEEAKVEPAQTESANAKLESASKLEAEGENVNRYSPGEFPLPSEKQSA